MINSAIFQLELGFQLLILILQSLWEVAKIFKIFLITFLIVVSIVSTQQLRVNEAQKQNLNFEQKKQTWLQIKSLQPNSAVIDEYLKKLD